MPTTIQVQETTKQLLDQVRVKEHDKTYDQVIRNLLTKHMKIPLLFGITKKNPISFKKEDEMEFNEV